VNALIVGPPDDERKCPDFAGAEIFPWRLRIRRPAPSSGLKVEGQPTIQRQTIAEACKTFVVEVCRRQNSMTMTGLWLHYTTVFAKVHAKQFTFV